MSWTDLSWTEGRRRIGRPVPARRFERRAVRGRGGAALGVGSGRTVGGVDRRGPGTLTAASLRGAAASCLPRSAAGSIGWLVVLAALTFLVVLGLGMSAGGAGAAPVPQNTVLVQVRHGETLWTVARRMVPSAGAADVVARIRQLNGLDGDGVYPGELLQVPDGLPNGGGSAAGVVGN